MSFAERMKARQAELAATGQVPTTPLASPPAPAPTPTSRFESTVPAEKKGFGFKAPEPTPAPEPTKEVAPLPNVIQAFNVAGAAKPTIGESLSGIPPQEAVKIIQQKIMDISVLEDGSDIRYEMEKLSELLIANPSACLYLMDEDLGLTVRALRKMTDNRVAIDMGRSKKGSKASTSSSTKLTAEDMAAAMAEL